MMHTKLLIITILFGYSSACLPAVTTVIGTRAPTGQICSGDLIFEDNFDSLDDSKWIHEVSMWGGGNNEFQWYVNDRFNSFTMGGNLHLRTTLTSSIFGEDFLTSGHAKIPADQCTNPENNGCERWGSTDEIINPIRSALLSSSESFSFKYGTMEVRARMPSGDWLWPAIWMMPRNSVYGGWPRSGEIDLVESRGNRQLYSGNTHVGTQQIGSTMHFGPSPDVNGAWSAHGLKNNYPGFNDNFHTYKLFWSPEYIQCFVDDQVVMTADAGEGFWKRGNFEGSGFENPWKNGKMIAPFDQEFYIILNLAVGGTNHFFSDEFRNEPYYKPWWNSSPRAAADFWAAKNNWLPTWNLGKNDDGDLKIDYVRVYAL